jgi:ribosomal protein S18 acetylase RimI-like enzyme/predicted nucleic acid-binding protein
MKFLLDTNIILAIEDNRPIDSTFSLLARKSSEHGINLFIDSAIVDDVKRDRDEARRQITLSKLEKFEILRPVSQSVIDKISAETGGALRPNDENDIRILAAASANAVDFLITEDLGLHRRARRANLADRVLTVADALKFVAQKFDPSEVILPFIREVKAYEIDRNADIFESLREDYDGFDHWFEHKCARQHRDCWIVEIGTEIAGLLIPKEESPVDTDATLHGNKILKICTFKMRPAYRGEKFGEQLLKKVLWHAQSNKYDVVYLTAFEKQTALISLLEKFGFKKTYTNDAGEAVFEKAMLYSVVEADEEISVLDLDRLIYPRIFDGPSVRKFIVPIRPNYHKILFPEIAYAAPLPLFGGSRREDLISSTGRADRTPGNTIRKVYLCRSPNTNLRPGDIILFYQSKDEDFANSQSITTLGVVENASEFGELDALSLHVARRSVFSLDNLKAMMQESSRPIKVIDFLLVGHSDPPVSLEQLIRSGIFHSRPPQSISMISDEAYKRLKQQLSFGYKI